MASASTLKSKPSQKQGMQGQADDNEGVNVGNTEGDEERGGISVVEMLRFLEGWYNKEETTRE
ncbi:3492_t:CDS:1, partial [Paraglomus brasilianum]